MTLAFLNPSRSFDEAEKAVRFIGHDGMFEVRFFVEAGALAKAGASAGRTQLSESECLTAFDAARELNPRCRTPSLFPRSPHLLHPDRRRFP